MVVYVAWDVKNPKGRIASVLSAVLWSILIVLVILHGDWTEFTIPILILFVLLLVLSLLRIFQEWKEEGEWLE
ncbi:MAG: hypothetical protein AYK23_03445 [Candidatus Proteinoplasmatales archaeon SG8-5]|nr:MAG: hypothetical protein AYK23_03445 [Candidatus Proteinoplasmatales archaeon SG8-5]